MIIEPNNYEKICCWTCIQDATQKDLLRETQKEMFLSIYKIAFALGWVKIGQSQSYGC